MSLFRKPKRNVRQRQIDSDEDDDVKDVKPAKDDDEPGLAQLQTNIAKFKEKKAKFKNKFPVKSTSGESKEDKKATAQLLSFDEDLFTGGNWNHTQSIYFQSFIFSALKFGHVLFSFSFIRCCFDV